METGSEFESMYMYSGGGQYGWDICYGEREVGGEGSQFLGLFNTGIDVADRQGQDTRGGRG